MLKMFCISYIISVVDFFFPKSVFSNTTRFCSAAKSVDEEKSKSFGRKAVSFVLITVTGGVALSALDDLAIYHSCSRYIFYFLT